MEHIGGRRNTECRQSWKGRRRRKPTTPKLVEWKSPNELWVSCTASYATLKQVSEQRTWPGCTPFDFVSLAADEVFLDIERHRRPSYYYVAWALSPQETYMTLTTPELMDKTAIMNKYTRFHVSVALLHDKNVLPLVLVELINSFH